MHGCGAAVRVRTRALGSTTKKAPAEAGACRLTELLEGKLRRELNAARSAAAQERVANAHVARSGQMDSLLRFHFDDHSRSAAKPSIPGSAIKRAGTDSQSSDG